MISIFGVGNVRRVLQPILFRMRKGMISIYMFSVYILLKTFSNDVGRLEVKKYNLFPIQSIWKQLELDHFSL